LEEAVARLGAETSSGRPEPTFAPHEIVESLQRLKSRLGATPPIDADLSRENLRAGRAARGLIGRLWSSLRKLGRTRQTVIRRRLGGTLVILGLVATATIVLVRLHDRFDVVASGIFSPKFEAERAVDGDLTTEWLGPDDRIAWLELRFARPLDVVGVKVVNAHNPPFNDRATRDLDVELYRKDRLLTRAAATFAGIDPSPEARTIWVKADGITRVRFVARGFSGRGAGLAEVEVIEAKKVNQ
ncbi:MAG TPA: hypothetical protein VFG23_01600, partial [Polyangia bacterium]|nr:hypothetical protein [Polyangia bacterium]